MHVIQKRQTLRLSLLCLIGLGFVILIAACQPLQDGDPAKAVEKYLAAMVKNERDQIPQLVCPDFEAGARTDFDSFGAVEATLDDMDCTAGDSDGSAATVTCVGQINYVYNGEDSSQDLSADTYVTRQIDGEWRMCGYQ